jgi:hypothetical protein
MERSDDVTGTIADRLAGAFNLVRPLVGARLASRRVMWRGTFYPTTTIRAGMRLGAAAKP